MKELFQYDPNRKFWFMGDLRCLDAFSTDNLGNIYYWQKNKLAITKLGAQIDGSKEEPRDFVIPYATYTDGSMQTLPFMLADSVSTSRMGHKQAKIARECIRYICKKQYIEKIMQNDLESRAATRIASVVSVSDLQGLVRGVRLTYRIYDGKIYSVDIYPDIIGYRRLLDLLRNHNEMNLQKSWSNTPI